MPTKTLPTDENVDNDSCYSDILTFLFFLYILRTCAYRNVSSDNIALGRVLGHTFRSFVQKAKADWLPPWPLLRTPRNVTALTATIDLNVSLDA